MPHWGDGKLQGEWLKLGHTLGCSTIRDVLKWNKVPPASTRREAGSQRTFLKHYHHQIVACDVFTVETVRNWATAVVCGSSASRGATTAVSVSLVRRRKIVATSMRTGDCCGLPMSSITGCGTMGRVGCSTARASSMGNGVGTVDACTNGGP